MEDSAELCPEQAHSRGITGLYCWPREQQEGAVPPCAGGLPSPSHLRLCRFGSSRTEGCGILQEL